MTEGQLRRARKLVRRLCANYDEGNCLALDEGEGCVCVQSISYSLLCRYFKEAVLPADAELCAAIGQGADELKRCRSCGKPFQARSNRALYLSLIHIYPHRDHPKYQGPAGLPRD